MADWHIEVLIIDAVSGAELYNIFFPWKDERVKDHGWSFVRRIEIRADSGKVEEGFRIRLAEWKAKWGLNPLQLRLLPLVVFSVGGGGVGQDRRLVEDGSLP